MCIVVMLFSDFVWFLGMVVVEWFNVIGGIDLFVVWFMVYCQMIWVGDVYVVVLVQVVGVEGGLSIMGLDYFLKKINFVCYGMFRYLGDVYFFDIFM